MAIGQGVINAPPNNDNIVYANPVEPNTFTHPTAWVTRYRRPAMRAPPSTGAHR